MKNTLLKITLALYLFTILHASNAQNVWIKKANFPGVARDYAVGFVIGHYGFIGCGYDGSGHHSDFFKWNQSINTWSAIATYPGAGYYNSPTGFTIEGKGYVGLGNGASGGQTDLWSYDTATNSWTPMASFPGSGRYDASVFVLGHKAYVISGTTGSSPYLNEVWMYDAHANSWTQLINSPAGKLDGMVAFAIGNHGYIGGGYNGASVQNAFWEFDSANDSWTSIASSPLASGICANPRAFVIGSVAYVCNGQNGSFHALQDGYSYDTNTHAWSTFTSMGANGIERSNAVAFTIGTYGYIGTGLDSTGAYLNDFWQYSPINEGINEMGSRVSKVTIYPNPNNSEFTIASSDLIGKSFLEIYNMLGEKIYSTTLNATNTQIHLSNNASGVYLYRVLTETGGLASEGKFIIQK